MTRGEAEGHKHVVWDILFYFLRLVYDFSLYLAPKVANPDREAGGMFDFRSRYEENEVVQMQWYMYIGK